MTSYIIPIERRQRRYATRDAIVAVEGLLARAYWANPARDHTWPEEAVWVRQAKLQILDLVVPSLSIRFTGHPGELPTVDIRALPTGDEMVFVATDCPGGDWAAYARKVRPDAIVDGDTA